VQPYATAKALPGRPHGGKAALPNQTWYIASAPQFLKGVAVKTQAPLAGPHCLQSCILSPVAFLQRPLYQEPSAETFLRYLC